MIKKFLKISLFFGIFSLFIFRASFGLAAVVGSPQLVFPSPGATNVPLAPNFEWKGGINATGTYWYEVQILKEGNIYQRGIFEKTVLTFLNPQEEPIQKQITGLSPLEDYEWWVRVCATDQQYCDNWSERRSFLTQDLTPPPDDGDGDGTGPVDLTNPLQAGTLQEAVDAFIKFLFYLAMAVAPILIVYAGFLILTAGGDATKIKKARQIILWTLVAVAVILFAKGFPALIKGALGG